jgi:hypothetical protein
LLLYSSNLLLGFPTGRSFTSSTTRQQVFWHHHHRAINRRWRTERRHALCWEGHALRPSGVTGTPCGRSGVGDTLPNKPRAFDVCGTIFSPGDASAGVGTPSLTVISRCLAEAGKGRATAPSGRRGWSAEAGRSCGEVGALWGRRGVGRVAPPE